MSYESSNYGSLDIMKQAFVLINCELGKEDDLLTALRAITQVKEARGVWGAYDIVAEIRSNDAESLRETITWKLRKMPSIRATLTLTAIEGQSW